MGLKNWFTNLGSSLWLNPELLFAVFILLEIGPNLDTQIPANIGTVSAAGQTSVNVLVLEGTCILYTDAQRN